MRRSAFTLLEAIVAVAVGTGVLFFLVQLLSLTGRWTRRAAAPMVPWEIGHRALTTAGLVLADGRNHQIATDGAKVSFEMAAGKASISFDSRTGALVLDRDTGRESLGAARDFWVSQPGPRRLRLNLTVPAGAGGATKVLAQDVLLATTGEPDALLCWSTELAAR
jgi:hypothetical protein